MEKIFEIETHRRIYDAAEGHYLTVKPSPDFPSEYLVLMTDKSEAEYYGSIRLELPAKFMRKIAEALIAACDEMKA